MINYELMTSINKHFYSLLDATVPAIQYIDANYGHNRIPLDKISIPKYLPNLCQNHLGTPIFYCSYQEMVAITLFYMSKESGNLNGIDYSVLLAGSLNESDWPKLSSSVMHIKLGKSPFFFLDKEKILPYQEHWLKICTVFEKLQISDGIITNVWNCNDPLVHAIKGKTGLKVYPRQLLTIRT